MKTLTKQLGVTLLEVMLVLAVAAMIIVMSIRYYQSATQNQQVNALLQLSQAIAAAADGLAQKDGQYNNADVTEDNIKALLPNASLTTPWGGTVTIDNFTATGYHVNFADTPAGVCIQAGTRLSGNPNFTAVSTGTCGTTGVTDFSYTYSSIQ